MASRHRARGVPSGLARGVFRLLGILALCSLGAASLFVIGGAVRNALANQGIAEQASAGPLVTIVDGNNGGKKMPSGSEFRTLSAIAPMPGATGHYDFEVRRALDVPIHISVAAITDDPLMTLATATVIDQTDPDAPRIVYEGDADKARFGKTITGDGAVYDVQVTISETAAVPTGSTFSFRPRVTARVER